MQFFARRSHDFPRQFPSSRSSFPPAAVVAFAIDAERGRGGGRARANEGAPGESAIRAYRRHDIAALRVILRAGEQPLLLKVAHIDLYFFDDVDVALLNTEVMANDLSLAQALDLMYRFGRAYPMSDLMDKLSDEKLPPSRRPPRRSIEQRGDDL